MMKNIVAVAIAVASASSAGSAQLVNTCKLADGTSNTIKVTREHQVADTYIYALHYSGKTEYFFGTQDDSRGGQVTVTCVGKKERVLVAYGDFTANYLQGFALIYNRAAGKIERLDFAEGGRPEWLYLGRDEAIVILPTHGRGENGGKQYVAYRHLKGRTQQPDPEGVDVPAPPPGYEAIRLRP
jgi:hypothetical protein